MHQLGDMTGQVALVTGGCGYRAGHQRAALRPRGEGGCGILVEQGGGGELAAEHPGSSVHQGNIGSHEDCERVVEEVLDTHGQLDILVNAGITGGQDGAEDDR